MNSPSETSPPARVAWIETFNGDGDFKIAEYVATREGGVDRNKLVSRSNLVSGQSPPARVAWIETEYQPTERHCWQVATREGGVDRNNSPFSQ